ncbi:ROK family protein [Deinococcus hopiensis]|uniref:ROK family protein n=1 Tax=Deinococcus hopiensis TaxID=309885 RepID=UPI001BAF9AE7|nr:ROK family protein [Deinococcus hopiensis]
MVTRTRFSKSKVGSIVGDLIDEELIEEGSVQDSSGGRRPTGLQLHRNLGYAIGIDLGVTSVTVTVSDVNFQVVASSTTETDVRVGPGPVLAIISRSIDQLLKEQTIRRSQILGIGMGVPGPVEFHTGLLINPPLMPNWEGFNLREYFAESHSAPVFVDNDVNVMALGELHHRRSNGDSDGNENMIVVNLGTGIGAGIIVRGEVYRGADGAAGDIGHVSIDPQGPRCHCGNTGCIEALAGAPNIVREAVAAAEQGISTILQDLVSTKGQLTLSDVSLAARQGDPAANHVIQTAGSRVGQVLASLVNFFNPSHLLLDGPVAYMGPLMLASIRQSVYARSLPLSTRKLHIDYTQLGTRSGARGSTALAIHQALKQRLSQ